MKSSDLFVKALENEGVEYVFGIPGEENLDMLESLRQSNIQLILTRHEQAAGFMAATYGRLTGKVGVCMSTLGPGATNFVTAAAYAQLGAMPMMMITGQKPIKSSKQGQFQIVDIVDMMKPLTKYTSQIVAGDTIPAKIRESFRLATEERPGAVHLEFPEDVADEGTSATVFPISNVRRPVAEHKAIDRAVDMIQKASAPILLVGAGANRKLTCNMLEQFVEKTQIPFVTTQMGKGVIDETSELFIGNCALSDNDFVHQALKKADLIINIGHDVVEKPPFFMSQDSAKVIHINFSSAIVDPVYFPQLEVVGDIANAIWQIIEKVEPQQHWNFDFVAKIQAAYNEERESGLKDEGFPVHPRRLVADIRSVMPDEGIIALDNGIYKIWFAREYPAKKPNTVLLDNALATMGAGLPSAIAAKLVHPDRPVISICGDGGFMMNSQELETAVRLKLNLIVLLLNDNAYGMIKWKQSGMGFANYGLDYHNPDFVRYAESYGAIGHRLESTENLPELVKQCLAEPGVHLIDVPINYDDNHQILNVTLPSKSADLAL
jgi:acetolactate synthase-1/2/3 large subunit